MCCFPSAVLQDAAGECVSEGEAAGDGAAAQPKQSGAGETPTGWAGLLMPLTFKQRVRCYLKTGTCSLGFAIVSAKVSRGNQN